jgi:acetyl-CoA acetyltransferase
MATTRPACIVGIGETEYRSWGRIVDRTEFQLAVQAIIAGATDCGLPLAEIDGLVTFADPTINQAVLQQALGMRRLRTSATVWGGRGGASCGALSLAATAVESGQANYVVVFRSLCQGQTRRYGRFYSDRMHASLCAPFGLLSPVQHMALVMQRYRHEYGFEPMQMAEIALICRANANRNPRAVKYSEPLTVEAYSGARMIADPFRLYDCCIETDGACALIVTTPERAQDLNARPVQILAANYGGDAEWSTGAMGAHNMSDYLTGGQRELGNELFAKAGVTRGDIDVIQIYDHFSGLVFITLEDFGFCARGEGPDYVGEGNVAWPDGKMPMNTAGGSLSEAYVHGFNHIIEGVRQLRGESTSQVEDASVCLVTGGGGISPSSATILGA